MKIKFSKRKMVLSSLMIMLAFLTVFALWKLSDEPNSHDNGFKRAYLQKEIRPSAKMPLSRKLRKIAGLIGDTLYFSTTSPGQVARLNLSNPEVRNSLLIRDSSTLQKLHRSAILQVDSFGFALFDGTARMILLVSGDNQLQSLHTAPLPFTRAVRFSSNSVALRMFNRETKDQSMYRYDLAKDTVLNESQVPEAHGDIGLITGGHLEYITGNRGIYVTRYANHIYLLDSNMTVTKKSHTIDTFNSYTLKSQIVKKGNHSVVTNGSPLKIVNVGIGIDGDKLYVYSQVKADNEDRYEFLNKNIIDVYSVSGLKYLGSYGLALENKDRMLSFKVRDQRLYALYPGSLKIYTLREAKM